jgi:DoxX-like protein
MPNSGGNSRARSIAGNILMALPALGLVGSSLVKFAQVPGVVHKMALLGFGGEKLTLIAALELVSALLFVYRRTRSFGLLFLSAFLGAAICVHVQVGQFADAAGPTLFLTLAWVGTWLRHPEMLWSFREQASPGHFSVEKGEATWASREA